MSEEYEEYLKKLQEAKKKLETLPTLVTLTDTQKIKGFETVFKLALEILDYKVKNGYEMKDSGHWCFEAVMNLLGEDIWAIYNALDKY